MNKVCKIVACLMLIISIGSALCTVQASSFFDTAKQFITEGVGAKREDKIDNLYGMEEKGKEKMQDLIDFLWGIGLLVIFFSAGVLGIRYMFTTPDNKSSVKQAATPFLVGTVIIFGALTIWKLIIEIFNGSM